MAPRLSSAALALAALGPSAASATIAPGQDCSSLGAASDDAAALLQSRFRTASAPRSSVAALAAASAAASAAEALGLERVAGAEGEASAAETRRRHELIEELFAEVIEAGRYFDPFNISKREEHIVKSFEEVKSNGKPILSAVRPREHTWEICTDLDWSGVIAKLSEDGKGASVKSKALDQMVENLGLGMCFDEMDTTFEDATCAAIRAAIMSALTMSKSFVDGPIFANYSVVSWGKNPSWVNGSVSGLDYTKPLPIHATLHNPNGVLGYAVCDILRTVLTQSPNQEQTSTCSYVATLAALSNKAPATAIKMAVRALWTGQLTPDLGSPCLGVFKQQPGLVPFKSTPQEGGDWVPSFFPGLESSACLGNAADCQISRGAPSQNAGLTFMWSQSLISLWLTENLGKCPDDVPRVSLSYPGISAADAHLVKKRSGGSPSSLLWECNKVVDPKGGSCKVLFNKDLCGDVPDEDCSNLLALTPDDELLAAMDPVKTRAQGRAFALGITNESAVDKFVFDELMGYAKEVPKLHTYLDAVWKVSNERDLPMGTVQDSGSNIGWPSFNETLLQEVCKKHVAMLAIDATPLKFYSVAKGLMPLGLPFFGNFIDDGQRYDKGQCDHVVYLEKCIPEENVYVIWSWGTTFNLTKEWLLGYPTAVAGQMTNIRVSHTFNTGMVCAGVVADQITVS